MTEDLYEILGVASQATADEIKGAYKKRAKALHPDVAGVDNEPLFQAVTRAYRILRDPEKRATYDRIGQVDDRVEQDRMQKVYGLLAELFEQSLSNGRAFDKHRSVTKLMVKAIERQLDQHVQERAQASVMIGGLEELKGRISREGEAINIFASILDGKIAALRDSIAHSEEIDDLHRAALEELSAYTTIEEAVRVQYWMGGFDATSTSTSGSNFGRSW